MALLNRYLHPNWYALLYYERLLDELIQCSAQTIWSFCPVQVEPNGNVFMYLNFTLLHIKLIWSIALILELTSVSSNLCSKTCSDGNKCGGDLGFFSVYDSEATRPKSVSFVAEVTSEVRGHIFSIIFINFIKTEKVFSLKDSIWQYKQRFLIFEFRWKSVTLM